MCTNVTNRELVARLISSHSLRTTQRLPSVSGGVLTLLVLWPASGPAEPASGSQSSTTSIHPLTSSSEAETRHSPSLNPQPNDTTEKPRVDRVEPGHSIPATRSRILPQINTTTVPHPAFPITTPGQRIMASEPRYSLFPDIQHILDSGTLTVAVIGKQIPPMIRRTSEGSLAGHDIGLAEGIAQKLGVDIKFVETATTSDRVIALVADAKADIAVSLLSSDVRRALVVAFSQPYVQQKFQLLYNRQAMLSLKRSLGVQRPADFLTHPKAQGRVGVVDESVYHAALRSEHPMLQLLTYGEFAHLAHALREGQVLLGLHGELQAEYHFRQHPELAIDVGYESLHQRPSDIRVAVRPDAPNLLRWINTYLDNHLTLRTATEVVADGLLLR